LGDPVGGRFDEEHSCRTVNDLRSGQSADPREVVARDLTGAGKAQNEASHNSKVSAACKSFKS
jgi:hypothetical protein